MVKLWPKHVGGLEILNEVLCFKLFYVNKYFNNIKQCKYLAHIYNIRTIYNALPHFNLGQNITQNRTFTDLKSVNVFIHQFQKRTVWL